MNACNCNGTLGNTGYTDCKPVFKVAKKLIIVPTYKADGTENRISLANNTGLTSSAVTALLNHVDKLQRWYPTASLSAVSSTRAESTYKTDSNGQKYFIKQGVRSFTAEMIGFGAEYKEQLEKARCTSFSVYIVDLNGAIRGIKKKVDDGYLYPIKIDEGSMNVELMFAESDSIEMLKLSFDWEQNEDDSLLRVIEANEFEADLLTIRGLLDVKMVVGAITSTSVTFTLQTNYGSSLSPITVKNLLAGDFYNSVGGTASRLLNQTTGLPITITGLVEVSGTYTLSYAPQTATNVVKVIPVKNGYDFTQVHASSYVAV